MWIFDLRTLRGDLYGAITTVAVMLPVALAYGIALGLGPLSGVYAAIAAGVFSVVFGSVRSGVSGPGPSLAIVMAVVVTHHASSAAEAFTVVMLAGVIQIALGALRIGSFVAYTPYSVISGFMSGIGITIIAMQAQPILGGAVTPDGVLDSIRGLSDAVRELNPDALVVAAAALAVCFFWPRRIRNLLPAPLAALVLGTLAAIFWFDDAPVIGAMTSGLPSLQPPSLSPAFLASALQPAFILAFVSSANSLLTLMVADSLTRRHHDPDRELVGQGIGNLANGLIGGLPTGSSTPFTVLNIRAGARTALSGALRAALLLALALGAGRLVEPIPQAVLAAILVKVGWDMIDRRFLARIFDIGRSYVVVMLLTLVLTVLVDLITGVTMGLIAAGIAQARHAERLELDSVVSTPILDQALFADHAKTADLDPFAARVGLVALRGPLSVASSNELAKIAAANVKEHQVVILDFSETTHMDDSAALVMEQVIAVAGEEGTDCIVMNLSSTVGSTLHSLGALSRVPEDRFVANLDEARILARRLLGGGAHPKETVSSATKK